MNNDDIWDSTPDDNGVTWPDLDYNEERYYRVKYAQRGRTPGIGYAVCYRCAENASAHVYLRVSSLTPVCLQHLQGLTYATMRGDLTETGAYKPVRV